MRYSGHCLVGPTECDSIERLHARAEPKTFTLTFYLNTYDTVKISKCHLKATNDVIFSKAIKFPSSSTSCHLFIMFAISWIYW